MSIRVVCHLPTTDGFGGISRDVFCGTLSNDNIFTPNPRFIRILHAFIKEHAPNDPSLQEEIKHKKTGYVYILDARTKDPFGTVPSCDIIGGFKIDNSQINDYFENPNYLAFTSDGLTTLPYHLNALFIEKLRILNRKYQELLNQS
ncbi:unnamed protein product [Cunninghamella blakesleeana]